MNSNHDDNDENHNHTLDPLAQARSRLNDARNYISAARARDAAAHTESDDGAIEADSPPRAHIVTDRHSGSSPAPISLTPTSPDSPFPEGLFDVGSEGVGFLSYPATTRTTTTTPESVPVPAPVPVPVPAPRRRFSYASVVSSGQALTGDSPATTNHSSSGDSGSGERPSVPGVPGSGVVSIHEDSSGLRSPEVGPNPAGVGQSSSPSIVSNSVAHYYHHQQHHHLHHSHNHHHHHHHHHLLHHHAAHSHERHPPPHYADNHFPIARNYNHLQLQPSSTSSPTPRSPPTPSVLRQSPSLTATPTSPFAQHNFAELEVSFPPLGTAAAVVPRRQRRYSRTHQQQQQQQQQQRSTPSTTEPTPLQTTAATTDAVASSVTNLPAAEASSPTLDPVSLDMQASHSSYTTSGSPPSSTMTSQTPWRKTTPLNSASYSRQFSHLPSADARGSASSASSTTTGPPRFFIPSYLKHSRYVARLEAINDASVAQQQRTGNAPTTSTSGAGTVGAYGTSNPSSSTFSLSASSSNVNLHRMAPSHRGMTYDIVESHPPPSAHEENLTPLPARWSESDKSAGLELLGDSLEVKYTLPVKQHDYEAAAVRADWHMPPQCGIYYYEATIMSKTKDGYVQAIVLPVGILVLLLISSSRMIAIGFSTNKASVERLPGWEQESWAYHGDDGKAFMGEAQTAGKPYGPQFTMHDIIGCGVNFRTGTAFFTKNGVFLNEAFRGLKDFKLYPSVGMKKPLGAHLSVNFGQRPFAFNIDGMVAVCSLVDRR